MKITHYNKVFRDEHIVVNDNGFENCTLIDCILECVDNNDSTVILVGVSLVNPKFVGNGWPYDFIEAFMATNGEDFSYTGQIGNKKHTVH